MPFARPVNENLWEWLATKIEPWLLESEGQIRAGPECGGAAGTPDVDGRPEFLFPEAAGYYLTWLTILAESGHARPALASRTYRICTPVGARIESFTTKERIRWFFRNEVRELLPEHQLRVVEEYGGFDREPFDYKAKTMVFIVGAMI